jgi:hypothetical protein
MEEVGFPPAGRAWNKGSWFWLDWNDLVGRKSVLARLELLGMEKVDFGSNGNGLRWRMWVFSLTGMAWNGGSQFWHDCNGLESKKSLINELECLGMEKVIFFRIWMAWCKGSRFWPNWNGLEWRKSVLACL